MRRAAFPGAADALSCPMADRQWVHLCRGEDRRHRSGARARPLLHSGRKSGKQRNGRGLRQNLQARLVRVNPIPNAASTLAAIEEWMDDYNELHPHSRSATAHPASISEPMSNRPRVRFNGEHSTGGAIDQALCEDFSTLIS